MNNPNVQEHLPEEPTQAIVYVVDDEPHVLETVTKSLKVNGYRLRSFSNAAQLLAELSPDDLGCVVTDFRMPSMNGMELLKELKARDSLLSIVFVTGYATVPIAVEAMKQGAITLLEKPFKLDDLVREVDKAIHQSLARSEEFKRVNDARQKMALLTAEEIAVLECATQGKPNKSISQELSLSSRTVDRRRHSALKKLAADSIADFAVIQALSKSALGGLRGIDQG